MKFRKVAIWVLLLSLWGGTMIFANSAAQKVRVLVNSIEQEDGGLLIDGKTYLPLRQLATAMNAIVEWDASNLRATVHKPNVHMFTYQGNTPFGIVDKGFSGKIKVFAQIDNLKADISAVKVTITDPFNKEKLIQSQNVNSKSDNFWFVTEEVDYKFEATGKYAVRFYMKASSSDEWHVVSEKMITSKAP